MTNTIDDLINGRCFWCGTDEMYVRYHDREWGRPVHDDTRLFEKVCLEGFQSGLSWYTILKRREGFRAAFQQFDLDVVAAYTDSDVERLLQDDGIIRHRGKIEATINNAQRALELVAEFGSLDSYFWQFVPPANERPAELTRGTIPASTPTSTRLSKDLKKRGWKFVGPTTCYAFMQAMGLVNDHMAGCVHQPSAAPVR
ncbi:MAG: DNA-3-methyladenine glycosylase I [Propionibacteriaceae bacterium]|nr:DNA-3-methyladenine glycosylase I [Micropruina sp.]HBY24215.1 DNA-3-methyladenine glycosylase I [Propionibacteriaceae bacterium]